MFFLKRCSSGFTLVELVLTIVLLVSISALSYHFWFKPKDFKLSLTEDITAFFNRAQRLSIMTESEVKIIYHNGYLKLYIRPDIEQDFIEYSNLLKHKILNLSVNNLSINLPKEQRVNFPLYYQDGKIFDKNKELINKKQFELLDDLINFDGVSGLAYAGSKR